MLRAAAIAAAATDDELLSRLPLELSGTLNSKGGGTEGYQRGDFLLSLQILLLPPSAAAAGVLGGSDVVFTVTSEGGLG